MSLTRDQRIIGALLGVHAGDALGATCEFDSWARIRSKYPRGLRDIVGGGPFGFLPGHATDDTDLTRAVLLAYRDRARVLNCGGEPDVAKLAADQMVDWLYGNWPERRVGRFPPDVGGATLMGLQRYRDSGDPRASGAGEGQAGNGSLMRCIATGLFVEDVDEIVEQSKVISAITHDDERCTVSCAAYNVIVHELLNDKSPGEAVEIGLKLARKLEGSTPRGVAEAIEHGKTLSIKKMAENGPTEAELHGKGSGYVLESLAIAVAALLDDRPLEDVIVDVVRIGKDTDTNAAIAGGLLGARDGDDAIPEAWRGKLQFGDDFEEIARLILRTQAA